MLSPLREPQNEAQMCGSAREVVDASCHAEVHSTKAAAEAKRQSVDPCPAARLKCFLTLVVVPHIAAKGLSQLQGHPTRQMPDKLISPNPSVVRNHLSSQWVERVIVRSFWRQIPRFQVLNPEVEGEWGIRKALTPSNLNVVGQAAFRHDS